jgi:phospholipase/carboxylesterase
MLGIEPPHRGRLSVRVGPPTERVTAGLHPLGLGSERDGLLYVPQSYEPERPAPLALLLHGAGGRAQHSLPTLKGVADKTGMVLLAVDSRHETWDIIAVRRYGPDVVFIERALEHVFARCNIDPDHIAIEGFSDGASYALSLGLTNGDLFTHVLAFSPGFMAPARMEGKPRLFISHGTRDAVLPIERCSRRIVPQVQQAGYDVLYREFEGPHTVPSDVLSEAVVWFVDE